jgi:CBS domain-containing protein
LAADTVGKAMSRSVVTVEPDATHNVAAGLMKRKSVKRLPVVDDAGELVGILSRGDILSVYARPDSEIARELTDRIIGRVMALEPGAVTVAVTDGAVVLEGTVPTRTEADLLADLAPNVAGVISVDCRVGYRVDDTQRADEPRPAGVPRPNW